MANKMNFDTDIASRMLSALISDAEHPATEKITSIEDKKHYLQRWIDTISVSDRRDICNILVMNNKRAALVECSEGIIINLDTLPPQITVQIYDLMKYKREQKKVSGA
jgi:hypothetical protein